MKKKATRRPVGSAKGKKKVRKPPRPRASTAENGTGDGLKWVFFKANPLAEDNGFHNPGVETFKGNFYRYLAREVIQNSLDARNPRSKGPVRVTFGTLELPRENVPGLDRLQAVFRRCLAYWTTDDKAQGFFKRAIRLTGQPTVHALRIGDYNTTGVLGGDQDRAKNWYNLIRCSGASSKYGGEGGSFGIGKNAPFAASDLRTVLYSTKTNEGDHAFIGIARLVTHEAANGDKAEDIGYFGGPRGESVRRLADIPNEFRRTEPGTDVIVLGFKPDPDWEHQLVQSVIQHFWPAIHFEQLVVEVGKVKLSKRTLRGHMNSLSGESGFTAHHYYEAYTDPTHEWSDSLPNLKDVKLHLLVGQGDLPKNVAMVRKSGMVIYYQRFHAPVPYCGVFSCRSKAGNALLREMEPPRHDDWDPDCPEKGANKRIEKEFSDFIRDCIRESVTSDNATVTDIPDLGRFLPDEEDPSPAGADAGSDVAKSESFPERKSQPRPPKPLPVNPMRRKQLAQSADDGIATGGRKGSNGSLGGGAGGGTKGKEAPAVPVRYRAYPKSGDASVYVLAIRSDGAPRRKGILGLHVVGDDAREPVRIRRARIAGGKALKCMPSGKIGPVTIPEKGALFLEVTLEESRKVAMEVSVHEA